MSWSKALCAEEFGSISCGGQAPQCPNPRSGPATYWSRPTSGFFKLNFDGSKLSNGNASLRFVIQDYQGDAILAGGRPLGCITFILQVETWALKEGISAALSLNISNIIIQGDNLAVVNVVKKSEKFLGKSVILLMTLNLIYVILLPFRFNTAIWKRTRWLILWSIVPTPSSIFIIVTLPLMWISLFSPARMF